jgi:hypothetical protein
LRVSEAATGVGLRLAAIVRIAEPAPESAAPQAPPSIPERMSSSISGNSFDR